MRVDTFQSSDRTSVIALWQVCGLLRPWNNPDLDIDRKLVQDPATFFVIRNGPPGDVIASAMFGYDGHRGNLYYLAVHPDHQGRGVGRQMMEHVERVAQEMGCPKIHLFIRQDNLKAKAFYDTLAYKEETSRLLGKRLIADD